MDPEIKLKRYRAYQRGFTAGAGMRPIDEIDRTLHVTEYDAGFAAGKNALREAMKSKALELEILIRTIHPMAQ